MTDIRPFRIAAGDDELDDLRRRLAATRWPDPETVDDWSQGIPLSYLRDLCAYWADGYDWRAREARLNEFPQFTTPIGVDGCEPVDIHFLHVRSPHDDAMPLVLTHGWPGSIAEFQDVIGPLTDPTAHGGDAADAFHVVCPSLPGYGFSGKPTEPGWGVARIAAAWGELMARLGYDRFAAQGGDWGSMVTTMIGSRNPDALPGHPPEHAGRDPVDRRRPDRGGAAGRRVVRRTTAAGAPATRSSRAPARRRSASAWPTRPPGSARGSWRSSTRGPTTTATPRTPSTVTTCSTT